jgi:hypothetical protein
MWAILEYLTILLRILSLSDKIYPLESIPRPLSLGGDFYEGTWKKNFNTGEGGMCGKIGMRMLVSGNWNNNNTKDKKG